MSGIYKLAASLERRGVGFTVVAASDEAQYMKEWLRFLGSLYEAQAYMQNAHWNVKAKNFKEIHEFFGGWYETFFAWQDKAAEQIKKLNTGYKIPNNLGKLLEYSYLELESIKFSADGNETRSSVHIIYLHHILNKFKQHIIALNKLAADNEDVGGANMLGDLAEQVAKGLWFTRAYTGIHVKPTK